MAIWLPLDIYFDFPVLLPWVVRDPTCRGLRDRNGSIVRVDEWSAPDALGYLRDDNSLVKALTRSLHISGPKGTHLNGARLGTEFVASHIWRGVNSPKLASRVPLLNTFVPNLVWLPSQVAKLSDREGSVVQEALKSVSWGVYRDAPVSPGLTPVVVEGWSMLPTPTPLVDVVVRDELNWFVSTQRFTATRRSRLHSVITALETLALGGSLERKVITTRYTAGLPRVPAEARVDLLTELRRFI